MEESDSNPRELGVSADNSAATMLRLLDFDDLFLLSHLLDGNTIAATAKRLGLTQPAVTQRVRKIERVFSTLLIEKVGRHIRLTREGNAICQRARDALSLMRDLAGSVQNQTFRLGATHELASQRLWPALSALFQQDSKRLYHCHIGSYDEILDLYENENLDALFIDVREMLPPILATHPRVATREEEFLLIANPAVAATINSTTDLRRYSLLDLDSSLPLLQHIEPASRAHLAFSSVWQLGSTWLVAAAAREGYGVAALPKFQVENDLRAGKLSVILPDLSLMADKQYLVYRREEDLGGFIKPLAEALSETKL